MVDITSHCQSLTLALQLNRYKRERPSVTNWNSRPAPCGFSPLTKPKACPVVQMPAWFIDCACNNYSIQ